MNMTELERRCLDRANGTWVTLDEDHTLAIVRAVLADAGVAELVEAGAAVVKRWDEPNWKDVPHTGEYIDRLRAALAKIGATQ